MNPFRSLRIRSAGSALLVAAAVMCVAISSLGFTSWPVAGEPPPQSSPSPIQTKTTPRFDSLVRDDFFAGMLGDMTRLDRGMKFCEDLLARNPKHADALVWHGGGLLTRASRAYSTGNSALGDRLWKQGLEEMNSAAALEPDNIRVKIGRSATLIGLAQSGWDPSDSESRALLLSAVIDYEKVYAAQKPSFDKISIHSRGELLFGLASGWSLLDDKKKARQYLELVVEHCSGTRYEREARGWLNLASLPVVQHDCIGCHISPSR